MHVERIPRFMTPGGHRPEQPTLRMTQSRSVSKSRTRTNRSMMSPPTNQMQQHDQDSERRNRSCMDNEPSVDECHIIDLSLVEGPGIEI